MKGGYTLVDCTGVDLTLGSTEQHIAGLHKKVTKAVSTGKMIIAENCIWGDMGLITPIPVFITKSGTTYICTSSTLQIIVPTTNMVTINNMVGD